MNRIGIIMVLVAIALAMPVASATDWQQFQKDEISIGWTTDTGPVIKPQLAWSNYTEKAHGIGATPIVADGTAFVLGAKGTLYAFNAKTGEYKWKHPAPVATGTFELSTPAYNDGIVYVATSRGNLNQGFCRVTALHASSGDERENITLKTTDGYQLNTPITYADDRIYLGDWNGSATTTNGTGTYWCLNASNVSDVLWNYTPDSSGCGYYWAGAAIVGDYVIFGDDNANVTCLNITASCLSGTGVVADYINVSEVCPDCSDDVVVEIRSSIVWNETTGRIYFTGKKQDTAHGGYGTGCLYAVSFNATTGQLNDTCDWCNETLWYSTSTPVYYDGRIYVGGGHKMGIPNSGKICCLHETNGSLIWQWYDGTDGRVQASTAVSIVNGHIYIYFTTNVGNGSAYCLEDMGSTYTTRWTWNPPAPDNNHILQGMAISDGMVYFGTDEGYVYALQEETPYDIDIDTSVAQNGDVNISWSGNATRRYDIFITDAYPNFGTTPAATGITVNHWIDADASDRPEERYYKVAYSGSAPGIVSDTVGYYNGSAKFGPDPDFTVLSVPHVINATDINEVLKYNHAPGQRLDGSGMPWLRDYVQMQNPTTGVWETSILSSSGTWSSSIDLPSDIGFRVCIKPGHTVPTNVVYRMLMRDTLGYLMV